MSIIELSNALPDLLVEHGITFALARVDMAMARLRMDVRAELMRIGMACDDLTIQKIIDGLPEDVVSKLLSERT